MAVSGLSRQVGRVARWLEEIYGLELGLRAEDYLVDPTLARDLLPAPSPSSGVVVVEEEDRAWVGLYVDPGDHVGIPFGCYMCGFPDQVPYGTETG